LSGTAIAGKAPIEGTLAVAFDVMTLAAAGIVEAPAAPQEGMIRRRHYRPPKRRLPAIHAALAVTLDDMTAGTRRPVRSRRRRQQEEEELLLLIGAL
jgi:hypothetical protein